MRLLKSNKLLSIVNSYVVDSPQPSNLSYLWNFGSLLATCLGLQLVTGIILAMHYTPNVDLAFISVEHIISEICVLRFIMQSLKNSSSNNLTNNRFSEYLRGFIDRKETFGLRNLVPYFQVAQHSKKHGSDEQN